MAPDESKFNTMKLVRCRQCGNVYTARISGTPECPECSSGDATRFRPDGAGREETPKEERDG